MDLSKLQNLCKREPAAYKEDFILQMHHFDTQLELFRHHPGQDHKTFALLVNFLAHVAPVYRKELSEFPQTLIDLLETHSHVLQSDMRMTIAKALIMLRNRNFLSAVRLIPVFFKLFRVHDKALRKMIYHHIVSDIKSCNRKHRNEKLNKTLQNFMYSMLSDENEMAASRSLDVMIELYRRHIWNNAKTVNIITTGCFSKHTKLVVASTKFFLASYNETDDDEEDESNPSLAEVYRKYSTRAGKTRKRKRKLATAIAQAKKDARQVQGGQTNWKAIELINDPQGFAEKLVSSLKKAKVRFEVKVMMMSLVSQTISCHELLVLDFYSYVQRYLRPHQKHITVILALVASAVHELVPPEDLEPIIRALADSFVSDRCTSQAIAIGINTIREICARQPLAMNKDLLSDLIQYKKYKDKGVMMAARSLLSLYREIDPSMLRKRDRGRAMEEGKGPRKYGEAEPVALGVDGIELLQEARNNQEEKEEENIERTNDEGWYTDKGEGSSDTNSLIVPPPSSTIDDKSGSKDNKEDKNGNKEENVDDGDETSEKDTSDVHTKITLDKEGKKDSKEDKEDEEENKDDKDDEEEVPDLSSVPRLDTIKILTDEDFELMAAAKRAKQESNGMEERKEGVREDREQVDPTDIEGWQKKRKMARLDRIAHARAHRENDYYGYEDKRQYAGTTNREKEKLQPFVFKKYSRKVQDKKRRKGNKRKGGGNQRHGNKGKRWT